MASPDPSDLSGRVVSHFRVLEPLGAGGMGVVYRAEDLRLHRTVALKFMRSDYTIDDTATARFLREARAVAALDHANICTVHEVGESEDGHLFLAMSYYQGETLRDHLKKRGALPLREGLDIATQMARGLARAHAAGIVHRDLKPANVMLTTDGTVKILDFGLAKSRDQTMTATGAIMGTVAYMSPEQLVGDAVDARSDLWSLGVVLFEMLTGDHPSRTDDTSGTLTRRLGMRGGPAAPRPDSTVAVARLVARLLRKDPAERYKTTDELLTDLTALRELSVPLAAPVRAGGLTRKQVVILVAALVVALGAFGVYRWQQAQTAGGPVSIAVLPLRNLSTPDQAYFADGLTEELIGTLTKIEAVRVIAHQSVLQFKESTRPAAEIASVLNVTYLVAGSVRQESDSVRITATLIDAARNEQVWTEDFDGARRQLMALQRDVALAITQKVQVALTPQDRSRLTPSREPDPEAVDLYMKGTQARHRAHTTGDVAPAIPYLKGAIEKDSNYATAYAGLALIYASIGDEANARVYFQKALDLEPTLPDAHLVRGMYLQYFKWNLRDAEKAFREAIRLSPGHAEAHHELSMLLLRLKRFPDALTEGRKAVALNPTSARFINGIAEVQIFAGPQYFDTVLALADSLLEKDSTFGNAYQLKGFVYEQQQRWPDAERAWKDCLRVTPAACDYRGALGYDYARAGDTVRARKVLDTLKTRWDEQERRGTEAEGLGDLAAQLANVYIGLGDTAQALTWLEQAVERRAGYMLYLAADPTYKPLYQSRRFRALLERIGLPTG